MSGYCKARHINVISIASVQRHVSLAQSSPCMAVFSQPRSSAASLQVGHVYCVISVWSARLDQVHFEFDSNYNRINSISSVRPTSILSLFCLSFFPYSSFWMLLWDKHDNVCNHQIIQTALCAADPVL